MQCCTTPSWCSSRCKGRWPLRSCWSGSDKTFLLSVGGFSPKFQPPPGFPTLQRVSISMPSGNITKFNLDGYFAVSSNTLQIGAHVDLFVGVDGFGIAGYLNFDTLIEWNPFYFDGDISGGVTLSVDGDNVMSLDLSADLTGPAPWHCAGSVHFSVLWFGVTKGFSVTFGSSAPAQPTDLIDVGAQVRAALSDPRNFTATLTANQNGLVSLLTPSTQGVAVGHPAAGLKVMTARRPAGPHDPEVRRRRAVRRHAVHHHGSDGRRHRREHDAQSRTSSRPRNFST